MIGLAKPFLNFFLYIYYTKKFFKSQILYKKFLISKLSHGVTVIQARGGYTGNIVKLIMCIVPTKEYYKVKEEILNIDKNALILVSDTYEVLGNK